MSHASRTTTAAFVYELQFYASAVASVHRFVMLRLTCERQSCPPGNKCRTNGKAVKFRRGRAAVMDRMETYLRSRYRQTIATAVDTDGGKAMPVTVLSQKTGSRD